MAGYSTLKVQQFDVWEELADVLETAFTGENQILIELQDFYESCIAEQLSDEDLDLQPFINLYQKLGQLI